MNKLNDKRHTLAHVLASVVANRYDGVQLTLGPAIDTGFYYDMDFSNCKSKPTTDEDLIQITSDMKALIKNSGDFTHEIVSYEKAKEIFKDNK